MCPWNSLGSAACGKPKSLRESFFLGLGQTMFTLALGTAALPVIRHLRHSLGSGFTGVASRPKTNLQLAGSFWPAASRFRRIST